MSAAPSVPAITRVVGGWVVEFPDGWSGPWRTEEAAKLARDGKFDAAHNTERGK